jgi:hypothetical protein
VALGLLEIEFLDRWTPFHSKNGICASTFECDKKIKKTLLLTPWQAKLLSQYLEHEAMETYESWSK